MRRAFIDAASLDGCAAGDAVPLPREAAHHLLRVLRLSAGAEVELFDGTGRRARGRLVGDPPAVRVEEIGLAERTLPPLVVAQALVRSAKLDEVVRRATELGTSRLLLFEAERSVAGGERAGEKLGRFARIAQEAARQCERCDVPRLDGPVSFDGLLEEVGAFPGVVVVGVVGAEAPLSEVLSRSHRLREGGVLGVVGPEGGLSDEEVARLIEAGATPVRLGAHVLRTETAPLAVLAAAQAALGEL